MDVSVANIFNQHESAVRSYCRAFPAVFEKAESSLLRTQSGESYLDFLMGCGSLNYGHNNPLLKEALIKYITDSGVCMTMDMHTVAKERFLSLFVQFILKPRNLDYVVQFPGPTGANAIEAAIKLARKVTKRTNIVSFTNGFHGCSLGALSLTGSGYHRESSAALLTNVTRMPYDGYLGLDIDTADMLEKLLDDPSSGVDAPAAIVMEAVQGEGGLNCARASWAQKIAAIAKKHGTLLIIDDIQAGVGRTGSFFSFEPLGITPDIICLAKAISGYGLPMALTLVRPEYDCWSPGEHNGTFRGNNLAFVTGAEAITNFWSDDALLKNVATLSDQITACFETFANGDDLWIKGRGLMTGLAFADPVKAKKVQETCFENFLILELCGPRDEVLKPLPSLLATQGDVAAGLEIISDAIKQHA
ncbi:MAG: diaminobutyrate--2-oxoglutarate transaminase [Sulfitobacter sp.]